ncbi:MAG: hypothetical protein FWD71_04420 [Oscillospiraceae bacterium]|nr:hypothetical protein [Oscillospiraceae bacterium]
MGIKLVRNKYCDSGSAVANVDITGFSPDLTGETDMTDKIQQAINLCHEEGGGAVYLPEGRYKLEKQLEIKTAVTLLGDYAPPNSKEYGKGTVLCCYFGRDSDNPQILMDACTGIVNMTVYYPEQLITNPIPYSPAIKQHGIDSMTVQNVTLVNPYVGISCGPDANELHYIRDVYISPLHTGVFMDMTTDIGRMQGLKISPEYCEKFLNLGESQKKSLRDYIYNNAVGVFMARSDWEYGYDIYIEGCKTGFRVTSMKDSGPNTQLSSVHIHNCKVGIHLVNVNPYGVALSDSKITSDFKTVNAILTDETFTTVAQFNKVDISGEFLFCIWHKGSGQLSFVDCSFDKRNGTVQENGGLSFINCEFQQIHPVNLIYGENMGGTQILGCGENINVSKHKNLLLSPEKINIPKLPRGGHKKYPFKTKPESDNLYNVKDFGAVGDGVFDNTRIFQKVLDEAAKTGGIVYVPAGWYRFDAYITIPTGVELRGVFHVPCHTMGGGSVLQPYGSKGNEAGTPFITMQKNSGLRGVVIHYPEQDPVNPVEYPWSVRAVGERCYLIDTVFVNSWLGAEFNCKDFYISYISGAPIKCGIYAGNNPGEGWIENVQYNPHYWFRSSLPNDPGNNTWRSFWHNQIKYLNAFSFGYNENIHVFNTFVFAALNGLYFNSQNGKGTKGKFIGHGTDGGEKGMRIDGDCDIDMVNTELVTIESPETRIYIHASDTACGNVRLHNSLLWGAPDYAVVVENGRMEISQANFVEQGKTGVTVKGGYLKLAGAYFYKNKDNVLIEGGKADIYANMTPRGENGESIKISAGKNATADIKFNWTK